MQKGGGKVKTNMGLGQNKYKNTRKETNGENMKTKGKH